MRKRRADKDGLLSNSQLIEVKRRGKLIVDALDSENDEKVEEIAIESIKSLTPEELLILGSEIERRGFYEVGEAIADSDLEFFGGSEEEGSSEEDDRT